MIHYMYRKVRRGHLYHRQTKTRPKMGIISVPPELIGVKVRVIPIHKKGDGCTYKKSK